MPVIEVTGAHKTYTRFRKPPEKAVDGLDLVVEQGGVHGFLGPNGSGKTTTIRMLLGLVGSDGGDLRLFGRPVPHALPEVVPHVGALVETPLFFPNFTGRLNLRLLADVAGVPARPCRGVPGDRRPARPGRRPVQGLLPRHEAAPRDRGRAAQGAAAADPGRAQQRPRPAGHRRRTTSCCAGSAPTATPRSSCPATCSARSSRSATTSRSWRAGGGWPTVASPTCWPPRPRPTYGSASPTRWAPMRCSRRPATG